MRQVFLALRAASSTVASAASDSPSFGTNGKPAIAAGEIVSLAGLPDGRDWKGQTPDFRADTVRRIRWRDALSAGDLQRARRSNTQRRPLSGASAHPGFRRGGEATGPPRV